MACSSSEDGLVYVYTTWETPSTSASYKQVNMEPPAFQCSGCRCNYGASKIWMGAALILLDAGPRLACGPVAYRIRGSMINRSDDNARFGWWPWIWRQVFWFEMGETGLLDAREDTIVVTRGSSRTIRFAQCKTMHSLEWPLRTSGGPDTTCTSPTGSPDVYPMQLLPS